jgi:hypothetical protein
MGQLLTLPIRSEYNYTSREIYIYKLVNGTYILFTILPMPADAEPVNLSFHQRNMISDRNATIKVLHYPTTTTFQSTTTIKTTPTTVIQYKPDTQKITTTTTASNSSNMNNGTYLIPIIIFALIIIIAWRYGKEDKTGKKE